MEVCVDEAVWVGEALELAVLVPVGVFVAESEAEFERELLALAEAVTVEVADELAVLVGVLDSEAP